MTPAEQRHLAKVEAKLEETKQAMKALGDTLRELDTMANELLAGRQQASSGFGGFAFFLGAITVALVWAIVAGAPP